MQEYRRKWHIEYMSSDIKPTGRVRKGVNGSNRMRDKQAIYNELKDLAPHMHEEYHEEQLRQSNTYDDGPED